MLECWCRPLLESSVHAPLLSPPQYDGYSLIFSIAEMINTVVDEMILFTMATSTMNLAFNLFALESNDLISLEILSAVGVLAIMLLLNFSYCYFAEMVAAALYKIGDVFYDSAWYQMPVKLQKIIMLPIQRTGKEMRFRSFGFVDCSLAMFLMVNSKKFAIFIFLFKFSQIYTRKLSSSIFLVQFSIFDRLAPFLLSSDDSNDFLCINAVKGKIEEPKSKYRFNHWNFSRLNCIFTKK